MRDRECTPLDEVFDRTTPIPRGPDLFYSCSKCGDMIPSLPKDNIGCSCGNVFVDVDAFRVSIDDYSQFRILRCRKKKSEGK